MPEPFAATPKLFASMPELFAAKPEDFTPKSKLFAEIPGFSAAKFKFLWKWNFELSVATGDATCTIASTKK